jgi:hemoglobin
LRPAALTTGRHAKASRSAKLEAVSSRSTMFERVGGEAFFEALTRRFYAAVAEDPVLRPLYPDDDQGFEAARVHLMWFLIQFFGGPAVYRSERGEPRLRARHARFSIGPAERDAWVAHMTDAVRAARLKPLDESQMLTYFAGAATQLVNSA